MTDIPEKTEVYIDSNDPITDTQPLDNVIFDKYGCGWKNEKIEAFDPVDEATTVQPSTPYVLFDISKSDLPTKHISTLRSVLRRRKGAFLDSSGTLPKCTTGEIDITLKADAQPSIYKAIFVKERCH